MSKIEDIKQEINRLQEQIDYLRTQQMKLKYILEELEPLEQTNERYIEEINE